MADYLRVRNWSRFQHYRDRNPPWIKLHWEMLASEDWTMLADASKLLAVVCMLVASRNNGMVPDNPAYLKRVAYLDKTPNLKPLIDCGFLEKMQADASESKQKQADATTETEGETETEKELSPPDGGFPDLKRLPKNGHGREYPEPFGAFWEIWPANENDTKASAYMAWRKAVRSGIDPETLYGGACKQAELIEAKPQRPRIHVQTWINREGWTASYEQGGGIESLIAYARNVQ